MKKLMELFARKIQKMLATDVKLALVEKSHELDMQEVSISLHHLQGRVVQLENVTANFSSLNQKVYNLELTMEYLNGQIKDLACSVLLLLQAWFIFLWTSVQDVKEFMTKYTPHLRQFSFVRVEEPNEGFVNSTDVLRKVFQDRRSVYDCNDTYSSFSVQNSSSTRKRSLEEV